MTAIGSTSHLEELAGRFIDDGAIERALDGRTVPGEEGQVRMLVVEAYEELEKFMKEHPSKDTGRCVHFDKLMQVIDDGECGKVWVSNRNVQLWKCARRVF